MSWLVALSWTVRLHRMYSSLLLFYFLFCFLSYQCLVCAWRLQLCLHDNEPNPTWFLSVSPHFTCPFFRIILSSLRQFFFLVVLFFFFLFSSYIYVMLPGRSAAITKWPTVPCLCFRATTHRHPSLEGEQIGQQTTAVHQSLWRRRWAEGSFVDFLCPPRPPFQIFTDFRVTACQVFSLF